MCKSLIMQTLADSGKHVKLMTLTEVHSTVGHFGLGTKKNVCGNLNGQSDLS